MSGKKGSLYKILIIDDDDVLRELILKRLGKEGYNVVSAADGSTGIETILHEKPDVVLLDQKLPDMTGMEVMKEVNTREASVSFIIMTGQGDEKLAVNMMKNGASDYLIKDTDFLDLLPLSLERILSGINTSRKLRESNEENERLQQQLIQNQKIDSMGRLAGGIAHDFNNMLGAILGHTELALEMTEDGTPIHKELFEIKKAALRSSDLTRQLLAFARKQMVKPSVIAINDEVELMLKMLHRLIDEQITLQWKPGKNVWNVVIDTSQLDQILLNLCINARDAIQGTGTITIETDNITFQNDFYNNYERISGGDYVLLSIKDNGCGMSDAVKASLFEPFFTTKEKGKGTGLGLATVYGAVKQNKGFVDVVSEEGKGTTMKIFLPRCFDEKKKDDIRTEQALITYDNVTVLLVEDEPMILEIAETLLKRMGFSVITADNPKDALTLAHSNSGLIDILMTDIIMPEMNGRDLAKKIQFFYPHIRVLLMSGYTADIIDHYGLTHEKVHFIEKPFSMNSLSAVLQEVLKNEA